MTKEDYMKLPKELNENNYESNMFNFNAKEWYVSKVDGRITHILREPTREDFKKQEERIKQMFEFLEKLYSI